MNNMLRKELGLAIHPFYIAAGFIFGAFGMIPQWVYVIIPLYFCWVSMPTLMGQYKSNKDIEFSALLPVSRKSIVAGRIMALSVLELLHMLGAGLFTIIHEIVYDVPNFTLDLGPGFLGVTLVIYGSFNLVFFPLYFRTARKFGVPLILAIAVAMLVAAAFEVLAIVSPVAANLLEGQIGAGFGAMAAGLALFALAGFVAYVRSAKRFEIIQL